MGDAPNGGSRPGSSSRLPRWMLVILGLLLVWIYTYRIASNPLKWEEPRRCLVAMEMIHSGDYVVPHVLGEPYLKKPPLQNWLLVLAAGNDARRVGPLTIRLISLLALAGACLFLWRLGVADDDARSVLPVLVFLTMGVVLQSGRSGEVDTLFACLVFAALACFELGRRMQSAWLQWFVSQLFVAAAVLTKLVAPVFFYPPVLYLAWKRRGQFRFSLPAFTAGLLAAAGLVGAWLIPYALHQPTGALGRRWLTEIVVRTLDQGWVAAVQHVILYPLLLLAWMLPWSAHLLAPRWWFWRGVRTHVGRDPWLVLCSAVVVWGALVFLFVPEHKGRYLLPVVPCLSVLIAFSVQRRARSATESARASALSRQWWFWALLAVAWVALVVSFDLRAPWPAPVVLPLALGLLALGCFAYASVKQAGFAPPLLLLGLIYGLAYAGFVELREADRGRRFVEAARHIANSIREERPIVCHKATSLKFSYALSQLVGRPLRRRPGEVGSTYWIAGGRHERDNLGPPLAETALYDLWQVDEPETWSLLGEPRFPPALPDEQRAERIRRLAEARTTYEQNPDDPDAVIWLGRRTAYLGHYRKAVSIYSEGIDKFRDDPRLYRHRGHRQISLRHFDRAIEDLQHAARLIAGLPDEVEPDGLPNALNIPTSTLHSNIWYHLGLAHYLKGDLPAAVRSYRECLAVSGNPDMLSATSHWLYMTLRRAGREDEARQVLEPIRADMQIIENKAYHRLLLMYKGELSPDELLREAAEQSRIELATVGYGVGNWHLYNGRRLRASAIFRQVVEAGEWAAFGHIAAEADLVRIMDRAL